MAIYPLEKLTQSAKLPRIIQNTMLQDTKPQSKALRIMMMQKRQTIGIVAFDCQRINRIEGRIPVADGNVLRPNAAGRNLPQKASLVE